MEGMLSPYRVLDLTDEKGLLCSKLLGDLGADVIKIERPDGDPSRNIGPFYQDEPHPEKSLFWFAFNTSKRGITLDIETTDGQEIFRKLAEKADFIIESFPSGYMDKLGLGYKTLERLNPQIIMVSITPFGQTGPYKDYKASDIVAWGMGGYMYPWGDPDRPPVRISHYSHAYLLASSDAVAGAMMALYYREMTGQGQQVDISVQDSVAMLTILHSPPWDLARVIPERGPGGLQGNFPVRLMWPCQDGYVVWNYATGMRGNDQSLPLIRWMEDEGMADDFIREIDWNNLRLSEITREFLDSVVDRTQNFFMSHTLDELVDGATRYGIQLYPVATTTTILDSSQLAGRKFWWEIEHSELGTTIQYPGAFVNISGPPARISRRAPLIGEHNEEIYEQELGLSKEELVTLKQAKII